MDGGHIIRKKFCIAQGFQGSLMDSTDRHDDTVARMPSRQSTEFIQGEMRGKVLVVMVDGKENLDQHWDNDEHYPGSLAEFGRRKYNHDNRSTHGTKAIDKHLKAPTLVIAQNRSWLNDFLPFFQVTNFPPASCHAGL